MTISTTTATKQYSGDGSTVSFPTVFKFLANADVQITHRDSSGTETVWVEDTQYTLTGAEVSSGGTVTVKTSPTDYTPASGETLTIERVTAETQGTDYPEGGAFPAAAHETALDRLTMLAQQATAKIARALKFPVTDASTLSSEIPNSSDRASKFLAFDSSGGPIASTGPTGDSSIPVSSYIETLLGDADAETARGSLNFAKGADIDSATALVLGTDGNYFDVAGTTTITSINTWNVGDIVRLHFDDVLTLTHHATNLFLPNGGNNITTKADDEAEFVEYAAGQWRCINYTREDGPAPRGSNITASGNTAFNWTGIPAGTRRITIAFAGISLSGTDNIIVQIGDAGGIETGSYISTASTGTTFVNSTVGFIMRVASAAGIVSGHMVLTQLDDTEWVSSHAVKTLTTAGSVGGGDKSLSATLDRVRVTRTGTDTFDAGNIVAYYE